MTTITYHAVARSRTGKGTDLLRVERDMIAPGACQEMREILVQTFATPEAAKTAMQVANKVTA